MRRRAFLALAALPLAQVFNARSMDASRTAVIGVDGRVVERVDLVREWNGPLCRARLTNRSGRAVSIKEIVLLDVELSMPASTALYGEGFQMLSQTGGTLGAPLDYSQYTDAKHYRIPEEAGARAFFGLVMLTPPGKETSLLAFTSCNRFSGRFRLVRGSPEGLRYEIGGAANVAQAFRPAGAAHRLAAVIDCEGLSLNPGETWPLEELMVTSGSDRAALLAAVGDRVAVHHPRLRLGPERVSAPPTGWCSWYCFGPRVTAQQVLDNLDVIARSFPGLKYVQIDDGYQSAMGDWLDTGTAFGGNVRTVLEQIRRRGFAPAIWVAPFVAEEHSTVFQQHREWFIQDSGGAPLRSDRVTFGGWRRGPWYALDGTHPEVRNHFETLFRTMREEWGCTYFKLDANFWGAMHGGRFHDPRATRIDAYRRGMQAILRGAGDAFLLGCNHPLWPSAGLVHGSRSSNDIKRTWDRVMTTARQNLSRNWQNGRLWWNDPDAVVLAGELTDAECQFHATAIYASGGMVLSGDDLTMIPPARAQMLRKLLPPTGVAATFEDHTLQLGTVQLPGARMLCLFNWDSAASTRSVRIDPGSTVVDYWTDARLEPRDGVLVFEMAPQSARLLKVGL